jgi:tripeptidyl-peptidase-1
LRALYGIAYEFRSPNKNSFGIVEYTPQGYVASDLDLFSSTYAPSLVGKRPQLASIDGGVVQTEKTGFDLNAESNPDLGYAMGLVGLAQPVTLYQVGDLVQGATFNSFLDALDGSYCTFEGGDDPGHDHIYPDTAPGGYNAGPDCGTVTPAMVISTSYGDNEADLSLAYASRQCSEYAKLGLMGVTVIHSSGDKSVAGNGGLCLNPDGSQSAVGPRFNPSFPSVCPFVTSVGATQVNPGSTVADPESACEHVAFSGGGFSNVFKIPGYQKAAVGGWRKHGLPNYPSTTWNSTGCSRGYPDLSANGANYVTVSNGNFFLTDGTSASALPSRPCSR